MPEDSLHGNLNAEKRDDMIQRAIIIKRRHELEILSKRYVTGCAVGFKERKGERTTEVCIFALALPKTADLPAQDLVPPDIEGVPTDVVENPPIGALAATPFSTRIGGQPFCQRFECMEFQKKVIIEKRLTSDLDLISLAHVTKKDIERATKGTQLWSTFKRQMKFDKKHGDPFRGEGQSVGYFGIPADRLPYPDASRFMRRLRKRVLGRRSGKSRKTGSGGLNRELVENVVSPRLLMKVHMVGAASGRTDGLIVGLGASVFVQYLPWVGGTRGEPAFSPAPAHGGRFPIDIIGIVDEIVQINFPPEPDECPWRKVAPNMRHYRLALFVNQLMTTAMAQPGDSGSRLRDENGNLVGVLFAGTKRFSYFHPAQLVQDRLGVEFTRQLFR